MISKLPYKHLDLLMDLQKPKRGTPPPKNHSAIGYQCPKDVDSEEGDGEGNKANSFESALQLQVVLCAPQTQPAGDSCQGCDKKETGHVAEQSALLTARARVLQPLQKTKMGRSMMRLNRAH